MAMHAVNGAKYTMEPSLFIDRHLLHNVVFSMLSKVFIIKDALTATQKRSKDPYAMLSPIFQYELVASTVISRANILITVVVFCQAANRCCLQRHTFGKNKIYIFFEN